jgi:hypothetical protein
MKFINKFRTRSTANINTVTTKNEDSEDDGLLTETDNLIYPVPNMGQVIDVLQMPWYAGKPATSSRLSKIPRGYIIERRQKLNSLLSGAIYYLGTILNAVEKATPNSVGSLLNKISEKVPKNAIAGFTTAKTAIQESISTDASLLKKNNLSSLLGIYLTEATGFRYALPYLNGPINVSSNWGDEGDGAIAGIVNAGMSIIDEISRVTNITQPGVYIQKPKYFNFEQEGKSVSFNFPLFNTVKHGTYDYKSNYEFLWLLAFQNKPYKTSFARTTPGKIYTVEVPGVVSMPYAYISEMSVDFRGTVRQLPVEIDGIEGTLDGGGSNEYDAPIPEAYVVNITFTSLLTEYANTMVGTGFTTTTRQNEANFNIR